jgi:polyisoprenoid-binding protein YceI
MLPLRITIKAKSLEIMDEVSKMDRREIERVMYDEVLEKNFYPKIEYKSARVTAARTAENTFRVNIAGDLTLYGTMRGMGVEAQVVAGEDTLRAQGAFTLRQSDYGLRIASVRWGHFEASG